MEFIVEELRFLSGGNHLSNLRISVAIQADRVLVYDKVFTPKVLANFSPGLALKPWDKEFRFRLNPERVCHIMLITGADEPFQGSSSHHLLLSQGCQSSTLGWH